MHKIKLPTFIAALILICSLSLVWCNEVPAADQKVFVLCYYSFLGNKRFAGDVSIQELGAQIDFFQNKGFHFVSFADVINDAVTGSRNLLIVIDDGNESVYHAYNEIFKPRHIRPILAIY